MSVFLNFEKLVSLDPDLASLRRALYHSDGPGYITIPNYVKEPYISHLRRYWVENPPAQTMVDTMPVALKALGQRPFAAYSEGGICYHNYLWNQPFDELSHAICFGVTLLRNQLEQQPIYRDLIPNGKRLASYRVLLSKVQKPGEVAVTAHEDLEAESQKQSEPKSQHYLKAILLLGEHGVDYSGNGLFIVKNTGEKVYPAVEQQLKPGTLLIWRYTNYHGVDAIQTLPNGIGFARMTFPHEYISMPSVSIRKSPRLKRFRESLIQLLNGAGS